MDGGRLKTVWKALQRLLIIFTVIISLTFILYPAFAINSNLSIESETGPVSCEKPLERSISNPANASIEATAKYEREARGINISYNTINPGGNDLRVEIPNEMPVVDSGGLREVNTGSSFTLNRSADDHWITYRMDGLRDRGTNHDISYPRSEEGVAALIPKHHNADVFLEPAKSGYVGSVTLYLGDVEPQSRTVGCQEFTIVITDDAEVNPKDRLDDLEAAVTTVEGGQRFESLTIFVVPDGLKDASGFVYSHQNDILIQDSGNFPTDEFETLTWIHEYVHTLQDYESEPDLYWTYEGMANYYAYKVALENKLVTPAFHDAMLSRGYNQNWSTTLNQSTTEPIAYYRGANIFAQLDTNLEGSNETVYDLLEWLNNHPHPSFEDFKEYLESDAGLSESTIESYELWILENKEMETQYYYSWSDSVPDPLWPVIATPPPRIAFVAYLLGVVCIIGHRGIKKHVIFSSDLDF